MLDYSADYCTHFTVEFAKGIVIEGYRFVKDGEIRYAPSSVGALLGLSHDWLLHLDEMPDSYLGALRAIGFQGNVRIGVEQRSESILMVQTISKEDLILLVYVEAIRSNCKAISLLLSAFAEVLENRTREGYNEMLSPWLNG